MEQQYLKIWFAGFYEGEGSLSNDKTNNNRLRLSISQNDKTPLILGQKIWGGIIRERIRTSKNKICYGHEWRLSHQDSLKFIEDIKPYLQIPYKIEQINKAFDKIGETVIFKCKYCDKVYKSNSGRRNHENTKHNNIIITYKCTDKDCNKKYKSKDSLNRHIKTKHADASTKVQDISIAGSSLKS